MRVMEVRNRNLNSEANGTTSLRQVVGRRFKNNGYSHVRINGLTFATVIISDIVWLTHPG